MKLLFSSTPTTKNESDKSGKDVSINSNKEPDIANIMLNSDGDSIQGWCSWSCNLDAKCLFLTLPNMTITLNSDVAKGLLTLSLRATKLLL